GVDDFLGEAEELVVLGHGLRLAPDGDDRAVCVLDPRDDAALGDRATGPLGGGGEALLSQELSGLLDVPVGLDECSLRVHHRSAGEVAELLDLGCGDLRRSAGTSSAAGCSEGVSSSARAGVSSG